MVTYGNVNPVQNVNLVRCAPQPTAGNNPVMEELSVILNLLREAAIKQELSLGKLDGRCAASAPEGQRDVTIANLLGDINNQAHEVLNNSQTIFEKL